jgi:hypothetical protein
MAISPVSSYIFTWAESSDDEVSSHVEEPSSGTQSMRPGSSSREEPVWDRYIRESFLIAKLTDLKEYVRLQSIRKN